MRIVVVGGGSAGHVIPALPVIEQLQQRGHELSFIGTRSGLEQRLVADAGVDFYSISAGKLRRYWSWQNITDLFRILAGVVHALWLIGRIRPAAVFSKGGFVSFPVALASWVWRVPLVAHESDLTPGLANRLVLPFAAMLCTSFAQSAVAGGRTRQVHTGTPIRQSMLQGDAQAGRKALGVMSDQPLLIITGGSLGAQALNEAVAAALPVLTGRFYVLHVTGEGKAIDADLPNYDQREYVDEGWGDLLAGADVVVSRAGANALFELLALGKLNVLVPLDAKASRGDQLQNAAFAEEHGYSKVLLEDHLTPDALVAAIDEVMSRRAQFAEAIAGFQVPDAARAIAEEIERAAS